MEETKTFLKDILARSGSKNGLYKRNLLREYLQLLVLDFIYSHSKYSSLIFYGGSCLCHCFGLPRLSEDLDFVDVKKEIDISKLSRDLINWFKKNTDLEITTAVQKFRIYLKFPVLRELGLTRAGESDFLFLKIELFKEFDIPPKDYKTEIVPLFKFNRSILIRTFDLPTLMATKLNAILFRKWVKIDKKGRVLIKVKGRDYFDLFWYLQKKIKPNLKCLKGVKDKKELKEKLLKTIEKIDSRSIYLDLEALIEDKNFVFNFSKNLNKILKREIMQRTPGRCRRLTF